MAGKYGSASVTVSLEDGPGGTARAITNHVLEIDGIEIESAMELSQAMGDSWEESTPSGMKKGADINLTGNWDTTATTGPHVVLKDVDDSPQDDGREMIIAFGDSKTCTFDVRLVKYKVLATVGKLTRFTALLRPTGAMTWA